MKHNKCPFTDYQKDYKAIAKEVLIDIGICLLMAIFICWCVYMA